MSIQPNRILARIVDQVDQSDWPELRAWTSGGPGGQDLMRLYVVAAKPCYATPIHFWVHALREDLAACSRRSDLVGAAGHALCRRQTVESWRSELERELALDSGAPAPAFAGVEVLREIGSEAQAYRMLESDCRRSSVVASGRWMAAHFWGHGSPSSWRREAIR